MNTAFTRAALAFLSVITWACSTHAQVITTYFSPRGGAAQAIIRQLDGAKTSIDVAAFQLSHPHISLALAAAQQRNITIRIIVDPSQESAAAATPGRLKAHQVPVRTDRAEKMQHNKYAIIDNNVVITGSFNWSDNAENRNAENLVVIVDQATAAAFSTDFQKHWDHSAPYVSRPLTPRKPITPPHRFTPLPTRPR